MGGDTSADRVPQVSRDVVALENGCVLFPRHLIHLWMLPFSRCIRCSNGRRGRGSDSLLFLSDIGGDLGLMRFGQMTSPPSLIHSGRSMLIEEQAVTPAPPWHIYPPVVFRALFPVARRDNPSVLHNDEL